MFEFVYLWVFLLIPLPLVVRYLLKAKQKNYTQVWIPLASGLSEQQTLTAQVNAKSIIPWLAWLFLLTALAKPIWFAEPIRLQQQSRDMIISLDLSGSMQEVDMPLNGQTVDRLT